MSVQTRPRPDPMQSTPSTQPGPRGCHGRRKDGSPCGGPAITGTRHCKMHAGVSLEKAKAKGAVVVELRNWGLNHEELRDPGQTLLQLMTQSAMRAELYAGLLQQAYEAAERLRVVSEDRGTGLSLDEGLEAAPHHDSTADRERAFQDLQRIFATGGVGALIGVKYAADKEGGVFATEEAIRGLVALEAAERDRCASMAAKAVAAGLAERQVRLAEQQGQLVAEALRKILGDLGMDPASPDVQRVVSTRLLELAG